jgi:crotonobetainyl-CoA:carnitine CoA-transferase CaiB-like acyl-CoA transferase
LVKVTLRPGGAVNSKYLSVGNPIELSHSVSEVVRSPPLGEHAEKILRDVLRYDEKRVAKIKASGATAGAKALGRIVPRRAVALVPPPPSG